MQPKSGHRILPIFAPKWTKSAIAAIAILSLTLATSGCSTGTVQATKDADAPKVAAAKQTSTESVVLRVGFISSESKIPIGSEGWALGKNWLVPELKEFGITEVKFVPFVGGPPLNEAIAGNRLDLGMYGDTPALAGRSAGLKTVIINQNRVGNDAYLITKKNGAKTVEELKGEKVGVTKGTYLHRYLLGRLEKAGIAKDVKLVQVSTADSKAALERGDIAAYPFSIAIGLELIAQGYPAIDQAKNHRELVGSGVTVITEDFLKKNPRFAEKWEKIRLKALEDIKANPDAFYKFASKASGYFDEVIKQAYPIELFTQESFPAEGLQLLNSTKGYCGTSGAAAAAGNGVWYIPPDPEQREQAMASREAMGGFLADRNWMQRVLDRTYDNVNTLADWGYPFQADVDGQPIKRSLQGPEYLRLMRKKIRKAGVEILDNSPALELLVDNEGTVAGARGVNRQTGESWTVKSSAVIIATGGCAFLSKSLGCNVLTGDGYLMAAEAGADFSGMEFSNAYAIAPRDSSVTKTRFYSWASFTYEDGTIIEGAGSAKGRSVIAKTLIDQPVYARLDNEVTDEIRDWMRASQPNFFIYFDRAGIDPFTDRFPITLRLEGTVRGTGGIRIADYSCATSVAGLYAAGDAATRELICGGFTGGGSHNAAWATSSGYWAGQSAAEYAVRLGKKVSDRQVRAVGDAYDRNWFRSETTLKASLQNLDHLWNEIRNSGAQAKDQVVRAREAASMVATARWMYNSGLARTETRGMHRRTDFNKQDVTQHYRLLSGGLDQVWVKPDPQSVKVEKKELVTV